MEQQDVFYDGAEYIETVSVGINNLGCFTTARIMHVQIIKVIVWHCFQSGGGGGCIIYEIILSSAAQTVTVSPLGFWEQGQ